MARTHRHRSRAIRTAAVLAAAALTLAGCDDGGGPKSGRKPGVNTPRFTVAMVSHAGEGDTFWDIVRSGAEQAAAKDNVKFLYANNKEGGEQAQLVQSYIDQHVKGLIVTLAKPEAVKGVVAKAVKAGIPVITVNAGGQYSRSFGAVAHIGQDESVAGEAVGEELSRRGRKKVLCVIHEQGNVSLEQRCAGVKKTFDGTVATVNVEGTNMPSSQSSIEAELQSDKKIDSVVTLGAPFAAAALKARQQAGSKAEIDTFDLNAEVVKRLKAGQVGFAVDQQPYLQGYQAVDLLWLNRYNADELGGGKPVLTGPAIVTSKDVPRLEKYTARGTR